MKIRSTFSKQILFGFLIGCLILSAPEFSFARNAKIQIGKIGASTSPNTLVQAENLFLEKESMMPAISKQPVLVSELDYQNVSSPEYPDLARKKGWEGTVFLKVLVSEDGSPSEVVVERTSGYEILDRSALNAVKKWKFYPARYENTPYSSLILVPVRFALSDSDHRL